MEINKNEALLNIYLNHFLITQGMKHISFVHCTSVSVAYYNVSINDKPLIKTMCKLEQ